MSYHIVESSLIPYLDKYQTILLAFSGGSDSTAMLHAINNLIDSNHKIHILHVHHGLQDIADTWVDKIKDDVKKYNVTLHVEYVVCNIDQYSSIEEAARKARYEAIDKYSQDLKCDCVFLGHHLRDQAETFLIQAMRGAGVAGLSSMPMITSHNIPRIRPWLNVDKDSISEYLKLNNLEYILDPSNLDNNYRRNLIRNKILPILKEANPGVDRALSMSARHCADANESLNYMAKLDYDMFVTKPNELNIDILKDFPAWRARNLLRYWYVEHTGRIAQANIIDKILNNINSSFTIQTKDGVDIVNRNSCIGLNKTFVKTKVNYNDKIFTSTDIDLGCIQFSWDGDLPLKVTTAPKKEGYFFKFQNRPNRLLKKQLQLLDPEKRNPQCFYIGDDLLYVDGLGFNYNSKYLHLIQIPGPDQTI